jgi:hypothetical protein
MSAPAMRPLGRVGIVVFAWLLAFGAALAWGLGAGLPASLARRPPRSWWCSR